MTGGNCCSAHRKRIAGESSAFLVFMCTWYYYLKYVQVVFFFFFAFCGQVCFSFLKPWCSPVRVSCSVCPFGCALCPQGVQCHLWGHGGLIFLWGGFGLDTLDPHLISRCRPGHLPEFAVPPGPSVPRESLLEVQTACSQPQKKIK